MNNGMETYVHNLHLEGDSEFIQRFNRCSDLFARSQDETLSKKERDEAWKDFFDERYRLEQGY